MKWELAGASCIGSSHRRDLAQSNGQDALFTSYDRATGRGLVVVADGCGSSAHSEVGAQIGLRLLADLWDRNQRKVIGYEWDGEWPAPKSQLFLNAYIYPLINSLRAAIAQLGHPDSPNKLLDAFAEYGLFSLNGVMFDSDVMVFFCIGDGVTMINDELIVVLPPKRSDPNLKNAPEYVGYAAVSEDRPPVLAAYRIVPTALVDHFVVATDGFGDFLRAGDKFLPGTRRLLGPPEQLWTKDEFFTQPTSLGRLLNLASTPKRRLASDPDGPTANIEIFPGLLPDDTTLIVGRRAAPPPISLET